MDRLQLILGFHVQTTTFSVTINTNKYIMIISGFFTANQHEKCIEPSKLNSNIV